MARDGALYKKIYEYFIDLINSGQCMPHDKTLTEMEVCEMFNVSRITAIKAFKELQEKGYIYRIKGKGTYISETKARTGKSKSNLIGLVVSYHHQLEKDFLDGLESVIRSAGYFLTIHNTENSYENERDIINRLANEAAGLILYIQPNEERNLDVFSNLVVNNIPTVLMDYVFDEFELPYVSCSNHKSFYELTKHVIESGHRKIAFVGSNVKSYYSSKCRYQGYCEAMLQAGIALKTEYIYDHFMDPDMLRNANASEMEKRHVLAADRTIDYFMSLDDPPTSIMAVNDLTAINILYAANRHGLRIPEDLSITGFDNLSENKHMSVKLTTADQQFRLLGMKASKVVLNQILGSYLLEKRHEVNAEIIIRDSVNHITR